MQSADSALIMRHLLIGASLAGVALLGTWGAAQQAPKWAIDLNNATGKLSAHPKEYVQMTTSIGAIIFTLITPIIGDLLGRRLTYSICCALAGLSAVAFYQFCHTIDTTFYVAAFLMGGLTATFYGFFPLYLPELFPTSVRATGQGFCFNVGRIIAAVGGLQIANLVGLFGTADTPAFAKAASAYTVLCGIYLVGIFIVWAAPETKGKGLT
jgi:MFS family permease